MTSLIFILKNIELITWSKKKIQLLRNFFICEQVMRKVEKFIYPNGTSEYQVARIKNENDGNRDGASADNEDLILEEESDSNSSKEEKLVDDMGSVAIEAVGETSLAEKRCFNDEDIREIKVLLFPV